MESLDENAPGAEVGDIVDEDDFAAGTWGAQGITVHFCTRPKPALLQEQGDVREDLRPYVLFVSCRDAADNTNHFGLFQDFLRSAR